MGDQYFIKQWQQLVPIYNKTLAITITKVMYNEIIKDDVRMVNINYFNI